MTQTRKFDWSSEPMPTFEDAQTLVAILARLLAGRHPALQGAALGHLLAMWLAGHPNYVREQYLADNNELVRKLIGPSERVLFNGGEHPQNTKDGREP